jgi:hypothetical protein
MVWSMPLAWYAVVASRLGLLLVGQEGFRRPGDSLAYETITPASWFTTPGI